MKIIHSHNDIFTNNRPESVGILESYSVCMNQSTALPKSLSEESGASPRCRQAGAPQVTLAPASIWQALAMDVTRYSSSVFLQPHQLISGWLQRAITAPFFWCLEFKVIESVNTNADLNIKKENALVQIGENTWWHIDDGVPVNPPVDHHRDPLPGSEGSHTLQLLVSDPYWNQKLLRVAGAQPEDKKDKTHYRGRLNAVYTAANVIQPVH